MDRLTRLMLWVMMTLVVAACTNPMDLVNPPAARVNGTSLSQTELNKRVDLLAAGMAKNTEISQQPTREELSGLVIEQFVVQNVLIGIATERKITATSAAVDAQVEEFRTLVAQNSQQDFDTVIRDQLGFDGATDTAFREFCTYYVLQKQLAETLVTTDTVRSELTADLTEQAKSTELQANSAHILVEDETLAISITNELNNGGDFAALAAKHSIDPGSKDSGGELGWVGKGQFVPEFEQALFEDLKPGEMTTTPVKSQFGYHIIKLIAREQRALIDPSTIPERVEQQIPQELNQRRSDAIAKLIEEARAKGEADQTIVLAPTAVPAEPSATPAP
jgi:parvulin-like peptidyl-prolyl isomerase